MKHSERKGIVSIVISTVIWGSVGINVRLLSEQGLDLFTINFVNMLIGAVFVVVFAKCTGNTINLKNDARITQHLVLQGLFFGSTVILLFYSFLYTSIAHASFLQKTMPLWVMILSVFVVREKITLTKVSALIIALAGVFLLFQFDVGTASFWGDLLALVSALTFSGMVLNGRKLKDVSEFTSTFFQLAVAGLLMLPFMIAKFQSNSVHSIWTTVFLLLFLGILNTGVTQRLFLYGLRFVEASTASLLTYIEPASATVLAFLWYGESVTAKSGFGILLIVVSVTSILFSSINKQTKTS